MAQVVARQQRPTLVIAPNKTLAAQLYSEVRDLFADNLVRYFVSYYDYYQPEAYIPSTDTYIEKDASINDEIDKMRHSATRALLERRDVLIVASVSCIYGLGAPEDYFNMMLFLEEGQEIERNAVIRKLVKIQYRRSDAEFTRGTFRVRGDTVDIFPADEDVQAIRVLFFGDEIEELLVIDSVTGTSVHKLERCTVYPTSHFVTEEGKILRAIETIGLELEQHLKVLERAGKLLEAGRLEQRTRYDMELMKETGFCPGVENYSRHLAGRVAGEPSTTLLDYFPEDFLLILDESHVTLPQLGGMYRGDQARKRTLVEHGFRLPSALDNRPLNIDEFWERTSQVVFVSATPAEQEIERSKGVVIEQIIRPTGLLDPKIDMRPATNQVDDLVAEIRQVTEGNEKVLALTLTKKMAERLADYLREIGVRVRYLHSDIDTIERFEILRALENDEYDVLVGINLLREGLDLPSVSLVAILDADKEGFLRSKSSLIQIIGRAARNVNGRVILYADRETESIAYAVTETKRRRELQAEYNSEHGIVPQTVRKKKHATLGDLYSDRTLTDTGPTQVGSVAIPVDPASQRALIEDLRKKMFDAAGRKEFELAAELRDTINNIQKTILERAI